MLAPRGPKQITMRLHPLGFLLVWLVPVCSAKGMKAGVPVHCGSRTHTEATTKQWHRLAWPKDAASAAVILWQSFEYHITGLRLS